MSEVTTWIRLLLLGGGTGELFSHPFDTVSLSDISIGSLLLSSLLFRECEQFDSYPYDFSIVLEEMRLS